MAATLGWPCRLRCEGLPSWARRRACSDLRDYELMFCTGRVDEATCPPDVLRLRRDPRAAQGIILGTPEYHASFSGVLKNALDLMGFEEVEGKMLGLVGVSAGRLGAINALNSLRMVGRALHAWVIPEQVSVAEAYRAFDAEGKLRDPRMEGALLEVGRQVARFAFLHSSAQVQEFLRLWRRLRSTRALVTRHDGDPAACSRLRARAGPVCRHADFGGQDVRAASQCVGRADAGRLPGDAPRLRLAAARCDHVCSA